MRTEIKPHKNYFKTIYPPKQSLGIVDENIKKKLEKTTVTELFLQ